MLWKGNLLNTSDIVSFFLLTDGVLEIAVGAAGQSYTCDARNDMGSNRKTISG